MASAACVVAAALLAGGGWAFWKDRVNRDADGFVAIGSATLRTDTYAIVGRLSGDGPSWLWGSRILGDSRVRATSGSPQPLFVGIARTGDVFRYLRGVGYATIDGFEVRRDTTHSGGAPTAAPSEEAIWAVSTQGTGRQTLLWDSRRGDWSIVVMNADARPGVGVRGDAGAKLPVLPWLVAVLIIAGAASGLLGGTALLRITRPRDSVVGSGPAGAPRPQTQETGKTANLAREVPPTVRKSPPT